MDLAHFMMLIHEFLNKDTDIVPEEDPLIILDSKSSVFMANNDKYINNTSHIAIRVDFVRNYEIRKIHKMDWCEGGLKLSDISTNNIGDNDLNRIMKYIMVSIDNL